MKDRLRQMIRTLTLAGFAIATVLTTACSGSGGSDRAAGNISLSEPGAVAVDGSGALYIADTGHCTVLRVNDGDVQTVVGTGACSSAASPSDTEIGEIGGIAVDRAGDLYISDASACVVRKWDGNALTTAAGDGTCGFRGDGDAATAAQLSYPAGLAIDATGGLYVADSDNCRIRLVSDGIISTVAGNGDCDSSGDGGAATDAAVDSPSGIAVDANARVYVVETASCRIRLVSEGTISTLAGDGSCEFGGPVSTALEAGLGFPRGIAVASDGTVYIADTHGCRVIAVRDGSAEIVAGDGTCEYAGDGGAATEARLNLPGALAVSADGRLFVADTQNCRIRLVRDGKISTVAGNGSC